MSREIVHVRWSIRLLLFSLSLLFVLGGCSSNSTTKSESFMLDGTYDVRIEIRMHGDGFKFYGDMSDVNSLDENGLFVRRTYDGLDLPIDKTGRLNIYQPIVINGYIYRKDAEVLYGEVKISLIDVTTNQVIREETKTINKYLGSNNGEKKQREVSQISLVLSP
ncbi:MAG: hypothetical protein Q3998_05745 [Porphyromonas sp.]|nr:hypothetical protein [Porphyromonas sp.]